MKKIIWSGIAVVLIVTAALFNLDQLSNDVSLIAFKPSPIVRVRLPQKNPQHAVFFSENGIKVNSSGGETLLVKPHQRFKVELKRGYFYFDGLKSQAEAIKLTPHSNHIEIDGHRLEGQLSLHRSKDGLYFFSVLHSELEPYIARVVMAEMPDHWHPEALRSQAIAARSFAVHHINKSNSRPYDLYGDARAQAFSLKEPSQKSILAAATSQGQILYQNQKPLLSYYISTCGGRTKQHHQGGNHYPSVTCTDCINSPHHEWRCHIPIKMLAALMGAKWRQGSSLGSLSLKKADSGHAETIVLVPNLGPSLTVGALELRRGINRAMGKEVVKSLLWNCSVDDDGLLIKGKGWGYHGIGMCQYGSQGKAKRGWLSEDILKSYYPQATISTYHPTSTSPSITEF